MTKRKPKHLHKVNGRPPLITEKVVKELENHFLNGLTDEQACSLVSISKQTLYNYCEAHPSFFDRKEMLKKRVDITAKQKLVELINQGDASSVKFWLERKCKDEFSLRSELTGENGQPLLPPKIIITNE